MLPKIPYGDNIRRRGQDVFRGLERNPFAGDGSIQEMLNMSGRFYPAISARPERYFIKLRDGFDSGYSGAYNHVYENYVFTVAFKLADAKAPAKLYRTDLWADKLTAEYLCDLPGSNCVHNTFTVMNNYLVIFPAGAVYNMGKDVSDENRLRYIDEVYEAPAFTIRYSNGTLYDIETAANTVTTTGDPFPFNVGDCVVFEGARYNDGVVAVIQEMSDDKTVMSFYENTFTWRLDADGQPEDQAITISRKRPKGLEHVMCVGNRLWACGGKHIAASADGDPFNWNTFEGTDADSWQVDILGEGNFTGCVNYGGTPIFFKPNSLIKVYGDYPSTYTTSETSCRGVKAGAEGSVAEVGGYLFWLSDIGVMSYSGGVPRLIGTELGKIEKEYGVAGSDGRRYYLCLHDGSGGSGELYNFDTETGYWYAEDTLYVKSFSGTGVLWATDNYGDLYSVGDPLEHMIPPHARGCGEFKSGVLFAPFMWDTGERKFPESIQLRAMLGEGASVEVSVKYDNGEFGETPDGVLEAGIGDIDDILGARFKSLTVPLGVHRCDYFTVRITGHGEWHLQYLAIKCATGSEK